MRRARAYVDTSVFGGACDEEFEEASQSFFARVKAGDYIVLISPVTAEELEEAPPDVRRVLRSLPRKAIEDVPLAEEARALAEAYIQAGVLPRSSLDDGLHVATATVAGADLIVSWNFRHIVNYDRIRGFNAVNLLKGYRTLDIRSPMELSCGD